ncbi:hypothetical protein XELAEV_18038943mg [Xenopus laevis]|uniref:G-protein coupled receptors family 3 profile domain-containing protein n=1 Tax=Xenopus laevis TaxID=8355 RepID=A0A974C6V2_XENLA|nr:hypothetical protein XELAEV_18038943mg [Xenopus laevis]
MKFLVSHYFSGFPEDIYNLLAFVFAVDEINNNPQILPNITLGYNIFHTNARTSVQNVLQILTGKGDIVPNYNCDPTTVVAAVIEGLTPSSSVAIADLFNTYKYTQVSFASQSLFQSDTQIFPYLYRMVPNEYTLYSGIMELLTYYGWTWIGIIATSDERSNLSLEIIKRMIMMYGGCVEFIVTMPDIDYYNKPWMQTRLKTLIERSTATVILVYGYKNYFFHLVYNMNLYSIPSKVWISTADSSFHQVYNTRRTVNNGSLHFIIRKREIPAFLTFLKEVDSNWFPVTWWDELCTLCPFNGKDKNCQGAKNETEISDSDCNLKFYGMAYNVYNAVYSVAHSLHNMYLQKEFRKIQTTNQTIADIHVNRIPLKMHRYLKRIHFINTLGERKYFQMNEIQSSYDIYNLVYLPNGMIKTELVGNVSHDTSFRGKLSINHQAITWDSHFSGTPRSSCSESCEPGMSISFREGQHICCYDCIPCSEGHASMTVDSYFCIRCPEDQWPNKKRTECVPKVVTFLSYQDPVGIFLAVTSVVFFLMTAGVLGAFIKHRDNPTVKANNRNLSFILLFSLMLSFLGCLTFIGPPEQWNCFMRQAVFGVTYAVTVSSLLAKTLTVVLAFNSTRIHEHKQYWTGAYSPHLVIIGFSTIQFLICFFWLIFAPPFPYYNIQSGSNQIILECNEGSAIVCYCIFGYLWLLASISFFVAFLSWKLPDTYNEAKQITFSMLVFFMVWISFIPAYLGSSGKSLVALEVFAILASSSGILGFIFAPKCKDIFLQPRGQQETLDLQTQTTAL